ncbi:hypothetical protein FACS189498_0360 [Spirochaetia bacterium]|nr:hypothetical protein FACS189498_0360 [Spirochaetia bacterium]
MKQEFVTRMHKSLLNLKTEIITNLVNGNEDFKEIVEGMDPKDIADIASDDIDRKMIEAIGSQDYGVAMAIHMAETPIAALAAAHTAAATENFLALEFHSVDVPWWDDLVKTASKPIINRGFIELSEAPGLGIEDLNDEVIRAHLDPSQKDIWMSTEQWDNEYSHDRTWS